MIRYILIPFLCLFTMSLFPQSQNSGAVSGFSKIDISGNIFVKVICADTSKFVFEEDDSSEEIDVFVDNGTLKIKGKTELGKDPALNLTLFLHETINEIEASQGAGIFSADTFKTKDLLLKATSGGKMELVVSVETLDITVSQGSDIVLYGKTNSQVINVSTWGNYLAYDLESNDSNVKATSKAQAKVIARRIISATSNGNSFIGYIGEPESTYVKTSFGGEIASFKTKELALGDD